MNGQAGKGDTYRPVNRKKYDIGWDRAFGKDCTVCGGKGYHWDTENVTRKMIKTTCLICNGKGKVQNALH